MTSSEGERWVPLGRAIKAHGVRGELRFIPDTQDAAVLLKPGLVVRCVAREGTVRSLTLGERLRPIHGAVLMTIEELPEREDVQTIAGAQLFVSAEDVPTQGDPYFFELVGARVFDETGSSLGLVVQVADNAGQPLLVIEYESGERLLPLVEQTYIDFVRETRRLVVRPIPGLWEDDG